VYPDVSGFGPNPGRENLKDHPAGQETDGTSLISVLREHRGGREKRDTETTVTRREKGQKKVKKGGVRGCGTGRRGGEDRV